MVFFWGGGGFIGYISCFFCVYIKGEKCRFFSLWEEERGGGKMGIAMQV